MIPASIKLGQYIINCIIGILAFACLVFLLFGDYLRLSGFAVSLLLIMLPSYLENNWPVFKRSFSPQFILLSQVIIALACWLNFMGSVNFYKNPETWWYDSLVHFINPVFLFLLSGALVVTYQYYFFKKSNLLFTLAGNFLLIIFFSFFWEFYEAVIDSIFTRSMMFGQFGEVYLDTLTDLGADFAGGLVATWLIYTRFYGYILDNTINYCKLQNKQ